MPYNRIEKVERTFAHMLEAGGARRTWLGGFGNVRKRHSIATAAYNLGVLMPSLFGIGAARGLKAFNSGLKGLLAFIYSAWTTTTSTKAPLCKLIEILAYPARLQIT